MRSIECATPSAHSLYLFSITIYKVADVENHESGSNIHMPLTAGCLVHAIIMINKSQPLLSRECVCTCKCVEIFQGTSHHGAIRIRYQNFLRCFSISEIRLYTSSMEGRDSASTSQHSVINVQSSSMISTPFWPSAGLLGRSFLMHTV